MSSKPLSEAEKLLQAENPPGVISFALAFFRRDFRVLTSYKLAFLMQILSVLFIVPMFYFMGKLIGEAQPQALAKYNNDYFGFLILGSGLLEIFTVTSYVQTDMLRNAQVMGTLEALAMTRLSIVKTVLFSIFFPVANSLFRFVVKIMLAVFVFNMGVSQANWGAALLILLFCLIAYMGIGLFLSAFILIFKKADPVSAVLNYATLLLGGVYFPVSYLPDWLQPFGWLIPATHAIEGARQALLSGAGVMELGRVFLGLSIVALVMLPLGVWALRSAYGYARRRGTLADY